MREVLNTSASGPSRHVGNYFYTTLVDQLMKKRQLAPLFTLPRMAMSIASTHLVHFRERSLLMQAASLSLFRPTPAVAQGEPVVCRQEHGTADRHSVRRSGQAKHSFTESIMTIVLTRLAATAFGILALLLER